MLWKKDVDHHDYTAAFNYLSLLLDEERAEMAVRYLLDAPVIQRRANDILRASRREPLPVDDPGVKHASQKKKLSPVLVVSFEFGCEIADGYHRVSLAYNSDPFADVPLRLAHIPELELQS